MRESAATCGAAGSSRELATLLCGGASATGDDRGWKQVTRQVPISGHTFCGQSGHGFAGLWQGICSDAAAADVEVAIARATDAVIGIAISAPSMASMPRTAKQRWNKRLLTGKDCHTFRIHANDTSNGVADR